MKKKWTKWWSGRLKLRNSYAMPSIRKEVRAKIFLIPKYSVWTRGMPKFSITSLARPWKFRGWKGCSEHLSTVLGRKLSTRSAMTSRIPSYWSALNLARPLEATHTNNGNQTPINSSKVRIYRKMCAEPSSSRLTWEKNLKTRETKVGYLLRVNLVLVLERMVVTFTLPIVATRRTVNHHLLSLKYTTVQVKTSWKKTKLLWKNSQAEVNLEWKSMRCSDSSSSDWNTPQYLEIFYFLIMKNK